MPSTRGLRIFHGLFAVFFVPLILFNAYNFARALNSGRTGLVVLGFLLVSFLVWRFYYHIKSLLDTFKPKQDGVS